MQPPPQEEFQGSCPQIEGLRASSGDAAGTLIDVSRPARRLPSALGESFTRREALASGASPRRVRASDLERPFHGVRLRREAAQVTSAGASASASDEGDDAPFALDRRTRRAIIRRARAYARVAPEHSFFVGWSAFAIHGLPLPLGVDEAELTVGIFAPLHAPRGAGVRGIKVSPRFARIAQVDSLPVADVVSAWALAAETLSVRDLVVLGDAVVCIPRDARGTPIPARQRASIDQLRAAAAVPWRRGQRKLMRALEEIRVGSMSPLETDYRRAAANAGLPEPELDVEIRDRHGRLIGISDVVYRAQRVIVEIEGRQHNTSDRQWNRDLDKYAALVAEGWEVVRLTARHIRGAGHPGIHQVRRMLVRRGWTS